MTREEIIETSIWQLYEKGRNYHRLIGIYTDTDKNYRFYNGDQWEGAKLGGVEPVQKNFIKPIVKYKLSVIHGNLFAINYSSENYKNREFAKVAQRYCDMLNRYARRIFEKDKMDKKLREMTKDAAINDEGIIFVYFDKETMMPVHEIVKKNDIYYGNEQDSDIESQPYIIIRKRMPVSEAIDFALANGMSEAHKDLILGDADTFEESGDAAKKEVDNQVTLVYKFYKKDGITHYSVSSRFVDIVKDEEMGIKLYPIAHMNWEEKEGSARGEGEVRHLIPNQIEVNKTLMRRVLTVKSQAYPYKIVDVSKVSNPSALDTVGGTIKTNGQPVDDVRKIVGTIPPAQMSPDVTQLEEDIVTKTRELAGAGDIATGQVNPEDASGRAILAVQQSNQAPITEQTEGLKSAIEDIARIDLEYLMVNSVDGIELEEEVTDEQGNEYIQVEKVPQSVLLELQATVKIDITPKGVYDKFAQEQTMENLLMNGLLSAQRLSELEVYEKMLPDDAVAPKQRIHDAIEYMKEEQRRIAMIQQQAELMQQRAEQFLMGDEEYQSQQIADAMNQLDLEAAEAEVAEAEEELPEDEEYIEE